MPAIVARFAARGKPQVLVGLGRHSSYIWAKNSRRGKQGKGNPMQRDPAHHIHTLLVFSAFLA
jgi:hypothetical protein